MIVISRQHYKIEVYNVLQETFFFFFLQDNIGLLQDQKISCYYKFLNEYFITIYYCKTGDCHFLTSYNMF